MRIAYVSDAIYPYNKGGKEKRLYELSTRLAAMGGDVHIYCMKWWDGPEKDRIENGVYLHAISKLYPLYSGERRSIKQGLLFGLAGIKMITKKFDVVDVDHMPFFPLYSVWLACILTFRRKRMFASWHEVWGRKYWVEYMGLSGNIAAVVEQIAVFLPYKINAISSHTTERINSNLHRKKRIAIIPCGIDYEYVQQVKPSKIKSDILYVGRLLKHKNVGLIIRAVSILKKDNPKIKCLIVGNGPEEKSLKKLTKRLQLENNVQFIDFLKETQDVYALMKSSKVFAFPSSREGYGIVVAEAIAANIPVVTVNAPDNASKTLIRDKVTGSAVKLEESAIAAALEKWLIKQSNDMKHHVKALDWQSVVSQTQEVYFL